MPELPEVEVAARNLRRWTEGHRIARAFCDTHARRLFRPHTPHAIERALEGRTVESVARRGKNLLITLRGPHRAREGVLAHLGMTGKWVHRADADAASQVSHARVRLAMDDGSFVIYRDPRMFGRVRLVPDADFDAVAEIAALGPDPIEDGIDTAWLAERLAHSRRALKLVVMDQSVLPGIGNIYASEALFRARLDPHRPAQSLTRAEVRRLVAGVKGTLRDTIAREDGPEITYVEEAGAPNPFAVYGHAGKRCPHCKRGVITRTVQGARATFYCPRCQT